MPKPLATRPRPGRYTYEAAALEVAKAIGRRGRGTHKALAADLELTSQQLSHRLAGELARFDLEQLGRIADFFDAPPGWPLIPWDLAQALLRLP